MKETLPLIIRQKGKSFNYQKDNEYSKTIGGCCFEKYESKIKSEQQTIQDLTNQISLLNKKVSKLELLTSQKENSIQPNTNNPSSINININNNGNSSSKWIIKQENQDLHNNNNNNNPNLNSFTNYKIKTRKINNFTKNNAKYSISNSNNNNLNIGKRYSRYGAGYTGFQTKNHKGMSTIDNNNAFTNTYNKILNNLCVKDIKDIKDLSTFFEKLSLFTFNKLVIAKYKV